MAFVPSVHQGCKKAKTVAKIISQKFSLDSDDMWNAFETVCSYEPHVCSIWLVQYPWERTQLRRFGGGGGGKCLMCTF